MSSYFHWRCSDDDLVPFWVLAPRTITGYKKGDRHCLNILYCTVLYCTVLYCTVDQLLHWTEESIVAFWGLDACYNLWLLVTRRIHHITDVSGYVLGSRLPFFLFRKFRVRFLTFKIFLVRWWTNRFNSQQFYSLPPLYLCFVFIW
jgi:hypothetical protein